MNEDYNFRAEQEDRGDGSIYRMSGNQIPKDTDSIYSSYHTVSGSEPVSGNSISDTKVKNNNGVKKVVTIIGAALLFGVVAGLSFQGVNWVADSWNKDRQSIVSEQENDAIDTKDEDKSIEETKLTTGTATQATDVSSVVENTMPSIVSITSTISQTYNFFGEDYSEDGQGSGSGIIVGKNEKELLVATNNHVVEGAKKIGVTFIDNEVVSAEIKGTDSAADLAVVAIKITDIKKETLDAIKVATLGNSDDIKVGQMAIAIGNALGYGQSVTVGYISAKDREVNVSETTMVLLQTDAAINPGNSGGALLNIKGELIGINSVKYASNDVEGMGYAIPITRATPIINELMSREKLTEEEKGYLGISGTDVTEEDSNRYSMPVGVYVHSVSEDGAAKEAGIVKGDIITQVNDNQVDSIAALQERVNSYRIGTKIKVTVMRNNSGTYEEKVITVTLKGSKTLDSLTEDVPQNQATPAPDSERIPQDPFGQDDGSDGSDWFNDPSLW